MGEPHRVSRGCCGAPSSPRGDGPAPGQSGRAQVRPVRRAPEQRRGLRVPAGGVTFVYLLVQFLGARAWDFQRRCKCIAPWFLVCSQGCAAARQGQRLRRTPGPGRQRVLPLHRPRPRTLGPAPSLHRTACAGDGARVESHAEQLSASVFLPAQRNVLRFTHEQHRPVLTPFLTERRPAAWTGRTLSIFALPRALHGVRRPAITHGAAWNTRVHVFMCTRLFGSLGCDPGVGRLGYGVSRH